MNSKNKTGIFIEVNEGNEGSGRWGVILWLAMLLLSACSSQALVTVTGTAAGETNLVTSVTTTNALTTATTSTAIGVVQNVPLVLMPSSTATNTCKTNDIFGIDLTPDGVTWSTTTPILITNTMSSVANATNTTTGYVIVPAAALAGAKQWRWGSQQPGSTNITAHGLTYSYTY